MFDHINGLGFAFLHTTHPGYEVFCTPNIYVFIRAKSVFHAARAMQRKAFCVQQNST